MNTKNIKKILFILILGTLFVFSFKYAHADWVDSPLDTIKSAVPSTSTPDVTINKVVNLIFTISEVAFVVILIVGGVMYLTSMGDEGASTKAKKLIIDAAIGIVIVLSAWGVGTWLLSSLKSNGSGSSSSPTTPIINTSGAIPTDTTKTK